MLAIGRLYCIVSLSKYLLTQVVTTNTIKHVSSPLLHLVSEVGKYNPYPTAATGLNSLTSLADKPDCSLRKKSLQKTTHSLVQLKNKNGAVRGRRTFITSFPTPAEQLPEFPPKKLNVAIARQAQLLAEWKRVVKEFGEAKRAAVRKSLATVAMSSSTTTLFLRCWTKRSSGEKV